MGQKWEREKEKTRDYMAGFFQGILLGKQEALVHLLHVKFPEVPKTIDDQVRAAGDKQLEAWGKELLKARKLSDMSFTPGA